MALRTIGYIDTDDLSGIEEIDRQIQGFKSGERGQISIPLDPEIAASEEYSSFNRGVNSLNGELVTQGLRPWPGETKIVMLDWRNRMVYIRFIATGYSGFSRTPSYVAGLMLKTATVAAVRITGRGAAKTAFQRLATSTGRQVILRGTSRAAKAAVLRSARASYKEGLKIARLGGRVVLPRLHIFVAGGAIIFFALKPDAVISLAKDAAKAAAEAAKGAAKAAAEAAKDALKPLGEGIGKVAIVAVAGVLVVGGLMMMRKR